MWLSGKSITYIVETFLRDGVIFLNYRAQGSTLQPVNCENGIKGRIQWVRARPKQKSSQFFSKTKQNNDFLQIQDNTNSPNHFQHQRQGFKRRKLSRKQNQFSHRNCLQKRHLWEIIDLKSSCIWCFIVTWLLIVTPASACCCRKSSLSMLVVLASTETSLIFITASVVFR